MKRHSDGSQSLVARVQAASGAPQVCPNCVRHKSVCASLLHIQQKYFKLSCWARSKGLDSVDSLNACSRK